MTIIKESEKLNEGTNTFEWNFGEWEKIKDASFEVVQLWDNKLSPGGNKPRCSIAGQGSDKIKFSDTHANAITFVNKTGWLCFNFNEIKFISYEGWTYGNKGFDLILANGNEVRCFKER